VEEKGDKAARAEEDKRKGEKERPGGDLTENINKEKK